MLEDILLVAIPFTGIMAMLALCWLVDYICNLIRGEAELPRLHKRKGVVGKKIRRHKYNYIEIVPEYGKPGDGFRVVRVRR